MYMLEKTLPHIDPYAVMNKEWREATLNEVFAKRLVELELAHKDDPIRPFITHEGLLNNIDYLRSELADFGAFPADVFVPLNLEFSAANLTELLHTPLSEMTAEQIAAEIYRRQAEAAKAIP